MEIWCLDTLIHDPLSIHVNAKVSMDVDGKVRMDMDAKVSECKRAARPSVNGVTEC